MAVPPSTDFSYENNVAPYASRFFGEIGADPNLRSADRAQLQGTLLQGVTDIATQREKLQQEAQQSVMGRLRIQEAESALEESRLRRSRIRQAEADDNDISGEINNVVYADAPAEQRHQALADLALKHSGKFAFNDTLKARFAAAKGAIPESPKAQFTPDKMVDLHTKLAQHPLGQAILATGDPAIIGRGLAEVAQVEEQHKVRQDALKADTSEARRMRTDLLKIAPKYHDDADGLRENLWLDPDVYNNYKLLMSEYGTPEENKAFTAEPDHHNKAQIAAAVQLREMHKRLDEQDVATEKPSPKDVARSLVGAPR